MKKIDLQDRLRILRESRGFKSQKQFCSHAQRYDIDIQLRRYGSIERGDTKPDIEEIRNICLAMKISADAWIFGRETRVDIRGLSEEEIAIVAKVATMLRELK